MPRPSFTGTAQIYLVSANTNFYQQNQRKYAGRFLKNRPAYFSAFFCGSRRFQMFRFVCRFCA